VKFRRQEGIWDAIRARPGSAGAAGGDGWRRLVESTSPVSASAPAGWLRAATDPTRLHPRLAPDVEVAMFDTRWGSSYAMVRNPRDNIYFRLDGDEGRLAASLDGTRTIAEIAAVGLEETGVLDLDRVTAVVDLLRRNGFLEQRFVDVYASVRRRTVDRQTGFGKWMRNLFKTQTVRYRGIKRSKPADGRGGFRPGRSSGCFPGTERTLATSGAITGTSASSGRRAERCAGSGAPAAFDTDQAHDPLEGGGVAWPVVPDHLRAGDLDDVPEDHGGHDGVVERPEHGDELRDQVDR
jgi:hypothetical protein